MSYPQQPCLPLPEPLRGADEGSFARITMYERVQEIIETVIASNRFDNSTVDHLKTLQREIPEEPVRPILDNGPDSVEWASFATRHAGMNWLEVPWLFAEIYLYRRILEATGYFASGFDPFSNQKRAALDEASSSLTDQAEAHAQALAQPFHEGLEFALEQSLWGNQADLSMFPSGAALPSRPDQSDRSASMPVNESAEVAAWLEAAGSLKQVTIVLDNAGAELIGDLMLADFLLTVGHAEQVVLHCKHQPFFVSDAMPGDVYMTLGRLAQTEHTDTQRIRRRLQAALESGQLRLAAHRAWTLPLRYWELPRDLVEDLGSATLLISKGDANYRRWLGDLRWHYHTPLAPIVCYAPAPLLLLRTLKSEVAAGLQETDIRTLNERDPQWAVSGRYGLIQFAHPMGSHNPEGQHNP